MAVAEAAAPSSSANKRPRRRALDYAYGRLARRAHSEAELMQKLQRAGYSKVEVEKTIERLRSLNYLDDKSFAIEFARQAVVRKRWGPARIEQSLLNRKLPTSYITQALNNAFPKGEDETAREALVRFKKRDRRGTPLQKKARAYRHLLGLGFSPSGIHDILADETFAVEK